MLNRPHMALGPQFAHPWSKFLSTCTPTGVSATVVWRVSSRQKQHFGSTNRSQHHFVFLYLQPVHIFAETKATTTMVDDSVASSLSLSLSLTQLCCPLLLLLLVCLHHKSCALMLHVFLSVWCISVAALQLHLQASHIYYNVKINVFVFLWTVQVSVHYWFLNREFQQAFTCKSVLYCI